MIKRLSIGTIIVAIFFLGVGTFAYSKTRDVRSGPEIIITTPENGVTVEDSTLTISGQALRVSELLINGRPILTDKNGYFKEDLLLAYGYNVIDLLAKGKFGGEVKKTLELVLK